MKPPKLFWPIRVAALVVAGWMSLYLVDMHAFGARFGKAVGVWLTPPPAPVVKAEPTITGPGVVPVMILSETKKSGQ